METVEELQTALAELEQTLRRMTGLQFATGLISALPTEALQQRALLLLAKLVEAVSNELDDRSGSQRYGPERETGRPTLSRTLLKALTEEVIEKIKTDELVTMMLLSGK